MKKVYLKPPYSPAYQRNGVFHINNGHNIYWKFQDGMLKEGIVLNTIDLDTNGDGYRYLYSDIPYPWEADVWKKIIRHTKKNVLLCFESPIVSPLSHINQLHVFFSKIYTWDDRRVDNKKYFKLYIPQLNNDINHAAKKFDEKKLLVLINAKKSLPLFFKLLSGSKKNLFNERLRIIDYFESHAPRDFSLYGKGWGKPDPFKITERFFGFKNYKTYKGPLPDDEKISVLSKFKFCICFENTVADGYITEKIFDCFKARCVPIYWGAPNITKYINKNCFIDFREFKDYDKLLTYLKNMSEASYITYIESIEKLLNENQFQDTWFERGFKKLFIQSLQ